MKQTNKLKSLKVVKSKDERCCEGGKVGDEEGGCYVVKVVMNVVVKVLMKMVMKVE